MHIYRNGSFYQQTLEDEEDKDGDYDKIFNHSTHQSDDQFFGTTTRPLQNLTLPSNYKKPNKLHAT